MAQSSETNAWVGSALASSIKSQLEAGGDLRVRDQLQPEILAPDTLLTGPRSAEDLAIQAESQWQLHLAAVAPEGSGAELALNYELVGPQPEGTIYQGQLFGRVDMVADLAVRAAGEFRNKLQLSLPASPQMKQALAELPKQREAQRLLFSARQALAEQQFDSARQLLDSANVLEPNHPIILRTLANTYAGLGYEEETRRHFFDAVAAMGDLTREKQLSIQAEQHIAEHNWSEAEELLSALFLLYPNVLDYGLQLARTQATGGKFEAARKTLALLKKLPDGQGNDPRIDLQAASAEYASGDWAAGLLHANLALQKARDSAKTGIEAKALWWLNRLDDDRDESRIQRAAKLFANTGNIDGQIASLTRIGSRARYRGDLETADQRHREAVNLARSSGNESRLIEALGNQAIVKDLQGKLQAGLELKLEVLRLRRLRGDVTGIGISLENLGISHYKLGNVDEARRYFSQANQQFALSNDAIGQAWSPWHEGRLLILEGKLDSARRKMEQAQKNAEQKPEGSFALHVQFELLLLDLLDGVALDQKDAAIEALARLREAYTKAELQPDAALTLLLQARVEHAVGDQDQAIKYARQAHQIFATEGIMDYELQAATLLVNLGQRDFCGLVVEEARNTEHQPIGLLAILARNSCIGNDDDLNDVIDQAKKRQLFEPLWLATHRRDPQTAQKMAGSFGWRLKP